MNKKLLSLLLLPFLLTGCNQGKDENSLPEITGEPITYNILPSPHEITYDTGFFELKDSINILFNSSIDGYTLERAVKIFEDKGILIHYGSKLRNDEPNLILETTNEMQLTSSIINEDISYIDSKYDAYYLNVKRNDIIVLGKNSDGVFYGLESLQYILEQSNTLINKLTIKDYADTFNRGYIEGFYGAPWTTQERVHLMEEASRVKANIYIYAPKNDKYHSTEWRSLYDAEGLSHLKEEISAGKRNKVNFAWAIHPFQNQAITSSNFDSSVSIIKSKFDQVYNAGCRQFIVCADDISFSEIAKPATAQFHAKLMNSLVDWNKSKGDCRPLTIVPSGYNNASNYHADIYIPSLVSTMDPSVEIMWTGSDVFSSFNNFSFEKFAEYTAGRKPFMWINWPVNDNCPEGLQIAPGETEFDKTYEVGSELEFSGIVTNPLVEAEPSIWGIYTTSCFAWNPYNFDKNEVFEETFNLIEKNKKDELRMIVDHFANTEVSVINGKKNTSSPLFKKVNEPFEIAYPTGSYQTEITNLNNYFSKLLIACNDYLQYASNVALRNELRPWVTVLRYFAKSGEILSDMVINYREMSSNELSNKFNLAFDAYLETSKCTVTLLNTNVNPNVYIAKTPLIDTSYLGSALRYLLNVAIELSDSRYRTLGGASDIKWSGFTSIYSGDASNISDGNENTYCWFGSAPQENAFIRLDLGSVKTINKVHLTFGTTTEKDSMNGIIQVSNDGITWTTVYSSISTSTFTYNITLSNVSGRYVRLTNIGKSSTTWVAIKEFSIS